MGVSVNPGRTPFMPYAVFTGVKRNGNEPVPSIVCVSGSQSDVAEEGAQARKAGDLPMRHVRNVFPHENAAGEKCAHSNRKKVEKHETCIGARPAPEPALCAK